MKRFFRTWITGGAAPGGDQSRARLEVDPADYAAIYAIGDVHGSFVALLEAECRILQDAATRDGPILIVMLGDYVDRGPGSRQVIDHLLRPLGPHVDRIALCGNHDDVFLQFLQDPVAGRQWLGFGAASTLYSYGLDLDLALQQGRLEDLKPRLVQHVPEAHRDWLRGLPVMVVARPVVFVHAGLRPGVALEDQQDEDLMWIREPFLERGPELPFIVVHGHTPSDTVSVGKSRIGIDTSAYISGRLTVLRLVDGKPALI